MSCRVKRTNRLPEEVRRNLEITANSLEQRASDPTLEDFQQWNPVINSYYAYSLAKAANDRAAEKMRKLFELVKDIAEENAAPADAATMAAMTKAVLDADEAFSKEHEKQAQTTGAGPT